MFLPLLFFATYKIKLSPIKFMSGTRKYDLFKLSVFLLCTKYIGIEHKSTSQCVITIFLWLSIFLKLFLVIYIYYSFDWFHLLHQIILFLFYIICVKYISIVETITSTPQEKRLKSHKTQLCFYLRVIVEGSFKENPTTSLS